MCFLKEMVRNNCVNFSNDPDIGRATMVAKDFVVKQTEAPSKEKEKDSDNSYNAIYISVGVVCGGKNGMYTYLLTLCSSYVNTSYCVHDVEKT